MEARSCLQRASSSDKDSLLRTLEQQLQLIEQFIQGRHLLEGETAEDREKGVRMYQQLLQLPQQKVEVTTTNFIAPTL